MSRKSGSQFIPECHKILVHIRKLAPKYLSKIAQKKKEEEKKKKE
jgi:hypothetical protein